MSHWMVARIDSFGAIGVAVKPAVSVGTMKPRMPSSVCAQMTATLRDGCQTDPALGSRDDPVVTVATRERRHAARVGSRSRLGQAEASDHLARRHPRQPLGLLLLRPVLRDRRHGERTLHRHERAQTGIAGLELERREPVLDGRAPRAAVALDVHAEQAELGELGTSSTGNTASSYHSAIRGRTSASTNAAHASPAAPSRRRSAASRWPAGRTGPACAHATVEPMTEGRPLDGLVVGRPQPCACGADGGHDARRPGCDGDQGRTAGHRRRHPPVGSAVGGLVELVLREREPQQAVDRTRLRRPRRPRRSHARSSTAPTSSSRTTGPERSSGTGSTRRPSASATLASSTSRSPVSAAAPAPTCRATTSSCRRSAG